MSSLQSRRFLGEVLVEELEERSLCCGEHALQGLVHGSNGLHEPGDDLPLLVGVGLPCARVCLRRESGPCSRADLHRGTKQQPELNARRTYGELLRLRAASGVILGIPSRQG